MKRVITVFLAVFTISSALLWKYLAGEDVYSGMNLINEGKYAEAVALLEVAPESPERNLTLGIACLHLGRYEDAEKYLNKVLKVLPNTLSARYSLAMLYEKRMEYKKAIRQWNRVLSLTDCKNLSALALRHIKILKKMER